VFSWQLDISQRLKTQGQCNARPTVTFLASENQRPSTIVPNDILLGDKRQVCGECLHSTILDSAAGEIRTRDLSITTRISSQTRVSVQTTNLLIRSYTLSARLARVSAKWTTTVDVKRSWCSTNPNSCNALSVSTICNFCSHIAHSAHHFRQRLY